MAEDLSLTPWGPRQPLDHQRLNRMQDRPITEVRAGAGVLVARKGNLVTIGLAKRNDARARQLVRMQVVSSPAADVRWRASTTGRTSKTRRSRSARRPSPSAGDEIYAFQPAGGTDKTYNENPVDWREVGGGGGGGVDLYNDDVLFASAATAINIDSTYGTDSLFEFAAPTGGAAPDGANFRMRPAGSTYQVIQWNGGAWVPDFVRAH
jgi:hypothetical protein